MINAVIDAKNAITTLDCSLQSNFEPD